jgi:hypothetical protein
MKIIKEITSEIEIEMCDFEGCGEEADHWNYYGGKYYCEPHYKVAELADHKKHIWEYKFWEQGRGLETKYFILKNCQLDVCGKKERIDLNEKTGKGYGMYEYIAKALFENKDLFDLLVEKLKERK